MLATLPTIAVSTIFVTWNACRRDRVRRERLLHERVAYMLWVAANQDDDDDEAEDDRGPLPPPRSFPR
jgi:hypothetical protein